MCWLANQNTACYRWKTHFRGSDSADRELDDWRVSTSWPCFKPWKPTSQKPTHRPAGGVSVLTAVRRTLPILRAFLYTCYRFVSVCILILKGGLCWKAHSLPVCTIPEQKHEYLVRKKCVCACMCVKWTAEGGGGTEKVRLRSKAHLIAPKAY